MIEQNLPTIRIAIIGAGPRGISALERLAANHDLAQGAPLAITLFDPCEPGGGRIWSGDQPQHLLMNTLCADATHYTDSSVTCDGPIVEGPNLYEWARKVALGEIEVSEDSIFAEATQLEPHSHPSRKILGRYLEWCYQRDLETLPSSVEVEFRRREIIGINPRDGIILLQDSNEHWHEFDAVIIASGHSDLLPNERERANLEFAESNELFYGLPTNPISQDLSTIEPGAIIAVRGLGMNFFDYMSLLTEGRGGSFSQNEDGSLTYNPSGNEPVLIAGSRRGVPYRAKGVFEAMTPKFEARYLTRLVIDELAASGRQLVFSTDIWPLAIKDAAYVYYRELFLRNPECFSGTLQTIVDALDKNPWESEEMQQCIAHNVQDPAARINFDYLDKPLEDKIFDDYADFVDWWKKDLTSDYEQAVLGFRSPQKCASVVVGASRASIRRLARYGGFTGESYAQEIQGWIRGFAGALASGPPARRINELRALVEAGVVLPLGSNMKVEGENGKFVAFSSTVPGKKHVCNGLLEAHLPGNDAGRSRSRFMRQIINEGIGRLFKIETPGACEHITGALEVGNEPYELVSADGTPQPGIYVLGVPLESIHWGTQLGPLAHTNSRFLRDSDLVARASIIHGRTKSAQLESANSA